MKHCHVIITVFLCYALFLSCKETQTINQDFTPRLMMDIGHTTGVVGIGFSPDGEYLVTGGNDHTAKIWDTNSGKVLFNLTGHGSPIWTASYSPDGKYILTADRNKVAKIWDASTGKLIHNLIGHTHSLYFSFFSPDSENILTSSADMTVKVWDVKTGKIKFGLIGHTAKVRASYSPMGNFILSTSDDETSKVWDAKSGDLIHTFDHSKDDNKNHRAWYGTFSSDEKFVIIPNFDGFTRVYEVPNGNLIAELDNTSFSMHAIMSPNNKYVVVFCGDGIIRVWNLENQELEYSLRGHKGNVWYGEFLQTTNLFFSTSADGTSKVWDAENGIMVTDYTSHADQIWGGTVSPDGKNIATSSLDGSAQIWDAKTGETLHKLEGYNKVLWDGKFNHDGSLFVACSSLNTTSIYDTKSGKVVQKLKGHQGELNDIEFSPNGQLVGTASSDGTAKIRNLATNEIILDFNHGKNIVEKVNFSPDSTMFLSTCNDSIVRVWNISTGNQINTISTGGDLIDAIFNKESDGIYVSTSNIPPRLFDLKSGTLKKVFHIRNYNEPDFEMNPRKLQFSSSARFWVGTQQILPENFGSLDNQYKHSCYFGHHTSTISSINYSPDGETLLITSWDSTASLVNVNDCQIEVSITEHHSPVTSGCFSIDGQYFVTADHNSNIKIWNTSDGKLNNELLGSDSQITSIAMNEDNRYLAVKYIDFTIQIWHVQSKYIVFSGIDSTFTPISSLLNKEGTKVATGIRNQVQIWDINTGTIDEILQAHQNNVLWIQFSPDGKKILSTSKDKSIKLWDTSDGTAITSFEGHNDWVLSASFNNSGSQIVSAGADRKIFIWEISSEKLIKELEQSPSWVRNIKFSKDELFVYGSFYPLLGTVWDLKSGKKLNYNSNVSSLTSNLKLSKNGNLLFSSNFDVGILIELDSNYSHIEMRTNMQKIFHGDISDDGKYLITDNNGNIAKIWDTKTGELIHNLIGHTSSVSGADIHPNNKMAMTSSGDGSFKFWSLKNGKEIITLLLLGSNDWVAMHPSGLFDASDNAMEWIYYIVNKEVVELSQLKERYWEPGLFRKVMENGGKNLRNVEDMGYLEMYPDIEGSIKENQLEVKLDKRNGGIGKVSLSINGKEVSPDINQKKKRSIKVDLSQYNRYYLDTFNTVSLIAYNEDGWLKSNPFTLSYDYNSSQSRGEKGEDSSINIDLGDKIYDPMFYGIIVGTSDYSGESMDLKYADKDAEYMYKAINGSASELFGKNKTNLSWLSTDGNKNATISSKENIKAAFENIAAKAKPEDVLFLYFSGHGVSYGVGENDQFYYLTKDIRTGDIGDPLIREKYTVSTEELTNWISEIPATKQVMVVDACASGEIVEDLSIEKDVHPGRKRALDRMKDRTGMFVLAGSAENKVSYEASQFGQGLLTYSLLEGMSGSALKVQGYVDVMELFQYARDKVPQYAVGIGGIQEPTFLTPRNPSSFEIGIVNDNVEIPLEEIKPVFIRSSFQEEESMIDNLSISGLLDKQLDLYSYIESRGIVFVDAVNKKNAYQIVGRYQVFGNTIKANCKLIKNQNLVENFTLNGNKNKLNNLSESILIEVGSILRRTESGFEL